MARFGLGRTCAATSRYRDATSRNQLARAIAGLGGGAVEAPPPPKFASPPRRGTALAKNV